MPDIHPFAFRQHAGRLEHRKWDVDYQAQEVGRACDELERRRKALADEMNWPYGKEPNER